MINRRRFPRLAAPVFARPARLRDVRAAADAPRVIDISLGGVRLYTDELCKVGDHLELEVMARTSSIELMAKVVWVDVIGEPAKYEIGAEFVSVTPATMATLRELTEPSA